MKTAIIYSGAMRSFARTQKNHAWFLWRQFPDARFFCATHDDEDAGSAALLPVGSIVAKCAQPELDVPAGCPAQWVPGQHYMHEPFSISVSPVAVVGQLWLLNEAWRIYEASGFKADLVVRVRPDLWFHSLEDIARDFEYWEAGTIRVPWWGSFGGVNDRFAAMTADCARAYFTTYEKLQTLIDAGAPLHPETLVHASLVGAGHDVEKNLETEFSTVRTNGEIRPPEITLADLRNE